MAHLLDLLTYSPTHLLHHVQRTLPHSVCTGAACRSSASACLLAIWAVASAATLVGLVRRHGWSGETSSALPMLLLVGAAIVFLPQVFPDGLPSAATA